MGTPDAIGNYRRLRAELETASVSPATCAALLVGLDAWEQGTDLAASLGLVSDPARFSRNARHGLRLDDRDDVLRHLASRATGSTWRRAQTIAAWRGRLARGDRLSELPVDTSRLLAVVGDLSPRQILRVLTGDRSA